MTLYAGVTELQSLATLGAMATGTPRDHGRRDGAARSGAPHQNCYLHAPGNVSELSGHLAMSLQGVRAGLSYLRWYSTAAQGSCPTSSARRGFGQERWAMIFGWRGTMRGPGMRSDAPLTAGSFVEWSGWPYQEDSGSMYVGDARSELEWKA